MSLTPITLKVKDLKRMLEQMNVPDDAEIWIEFPVVSGVCVGDSTTPTHEVLVTDTEQREDWINAATVGWSPGVNRVRIYHKPLWDAP